MQAASKAKRYEWHVLAFCGSCKDAALVTVFDATASGHDAIHLAGLTEYNDKLRLVRFLPEQPKPKIAPAIPENVKKPLLEAEHAFAAGLFSAAGSCYRKTVERALKALDPDLSGMLNKRIRTLETKGILPHSMIELLDQVRLFGNSSMHEDDFDPTRDECAAAREFCDLFLTYAFSLPAKVSAAKGTAGS